MLRYYSTVYYTVYDSLIHMFGVLNALTNHVYSDTSVYTCLYNTQCILCKRVFHLILVMSPLR